jgi:hypothetical protein
MNNKITREEDNLGFESLFLTKDNNIKTKIVPIAPNDFDIIYSLIHHTYIVVDVSYVPICFSSITNRGEIEGIKFQNNNGDTIIAIEDKYCGIICLDNSELSKIDNIIDISFDSNYEKIISRCLCKYYIRDMSQKNISI